MGFELDKDYFEKAKERIEKFDSQENMFAILNKTEKPKTRKFILGGIMLNKQTIKKKISIEQVARYYGLQLDRYGNCLCPFHNDENPSMKINGRKNGKAHCFVCGKSWDIFDFVMEKEMNNTSTSR